jgi:Mn2+/Fe2+ NRAMP family transporter
MFISNLIALFILLTTAATLHAHGITDIETSSQAAEALRPIAGPFAYLLFSVGIIGTGILSLPVLAGSSAYALGEAMQWPSGLAKKPGKAKAFYATIVVSTFGGAVLNMTPIDPIKALFWSAVINGVVAVPVMVMLMLMASNKKIMGKFAIKPVLKFMGWLSTAVMAAVAIAMFVTWGA